ncbi:MAG: hypothetical protein V4581_18795 [Bacteroidota bacterium]
MASYFTTLLLLATPVLFAQHKISVQDSLTQTPVPYVTVSLLNGYGIYTDANGQAIVHDANITTVELSSIGYRTKKVTLDNISSVVYLQPEPYSIEEVVIAAATVKHQDKVFKPKSHQNEARMAVGRVGIVYAVYIPGSSEGFISNLALPLMKKDFVINTATNDDVFKERTYKTLVKIEFLDNENGAPGPKFSDFEQVITVGGGNPKLCEVTLDENIALPQNGLFVKLTILGKADDAGNMINEMPYDVVTDRDGKQTHHWKQMQPNFPLYEVSKGQIPAYTTNAFVSDGKWKPIDKPLMFDPDEVYNGFSIGVGYTVIIYK